MSYVSAATTPLQADIQHREQQIHQRISERIYRERDQLFSWLFVAQWIFALGMAFFWAPLAWAGVTKGLHLHVYIAFFFGAALTIPPIILARAYPGQTVTRHVIAIAQMLWSALLIHLSGGRIETHFHIFGSLAFLAFYRDNNVLFTATLVVTTDHLIRALLWPESVYGLANPEWWRFLEHTFWVMFEDIVLVMSVNEAQRALGEISRRQAETEWLNNTLEQKVRARTEALSISRDELKESFDTLQSTQKQLLEASRRAGMADVATSVLHNVGNILNSVNVSANLTADILRSSKSHGLEKALSLLHSQPDPIKFLTEDTKGKKLILYIGNISQAITVENSKISEELKSLIKNIDHIKIIVGMQQSYAKPGGMKELLSLESLLDDAIQTNMASYENHSIATLKDFEPLADFECDRHKLFQVLINLLSNAKQALKESDRADKVITIRTKRDGESVRIDVEDNGIGIKDQNLDKIFSHGFTTKRDGHGFGLHASANAATEMGGQLRVHSPGPELGAVFTLHIPYNKRTKECA